MGLNVGRTGQVKFKNNQVINISSWSLDDDKPVLKVAVFDQDTMKVAGVGMRNLSGNLAGYMDTTAGSYQTSMESAYLSGGSGTLDLYFNETEYYSGSAYFTKINVSSEADDSVVPITMDFEIDGAMTRN